ncbi:MAG: type II toxin-antitoxin system VapC family toxin [Deltaproteobacteria bacterium]|nr:type II toxin-antitoxin system VapC family toxin [Deltaproteobacteria bacterium]
MKFWDSSAIIPLCLQEPNSEQVRAALKTDEDIVVWWTTRIECLSALELRQREGALPAETQLKARAVLFALATAWSEVLPGERVRQRAERLLAIHPLRAADALQLAAALIWSEEAPQGLEVVCLDKNLREGALKEGFTVLP